MDCKKDPIDFAGGDTNLYAYVMNDPVKPSMKGEWMDKTNCWEHKGCKKEECPAHSEKRLDGTHGGINAGRACWVVAGTRCGGAVQGVYAQKVGNCMKCDFYELVAREEKMNLRNGMVLLELLHA